MKGEIAHYDGVVDYRGNADESCQCGAALTILGISTGCVYHEQKVMLTIWHRWRCANGHEGPALYG